MRSSPRKRGKPTHLRGRAGWTGAARGDPAMARAPLVLAGSAAANPPTKGSPRLPRRRQRPAPGDRLEPEHCPAAVRRTPGVPAQKFHRPAGADADSAVVRDEEKNIPQPLEFRVGLQRDVPAQVAAFWVDLVQQGDGLRIGGNGRLAQFAQFVEHAQRVDAPAEGVRSRCEQNPVGKRRIRLTALTRTLPRGPSRPPRSAGLVHGSRLDFAGPWPGGRSLLLLASGGVPG